MYFWMEEEIQLLQFIRKMDIFPTASRLSVAAKPSSGEARDAGGITVDGVKFDADKYYRTTGNNNFNSPYAVENYVYDATNIRLREVTFGYTFRNLLGAGKNLTAAIIGRNLFFFHKDAPMDPDVSAGTGNGIQGVDMFALPTSRSFGLNLKLNF